MRVRILIPTRRDTCHTNANDSMRQGTMCGMVEKHRINDTDGNSCIVQSRNVCVYVKEFVSGAFRTTVLDLIPCRALSISDQTLRLGVFLGGAGNYG